MWTLTTPTLLRLLGISALLSTGHIVSAQTCYDGRGNVLAGFAPCNTVSPGAVCCPKPASGNMEEVCLSVGGCRGTSTHGTLDDLTKTGCLDKTWQQPGCAFVCGDRNKWLIKTCDDGSHCCDTPDSKDCCHDTSGSASSSASSSSNSGGSAASTGNNQPSSSAVTGTPSASQTTILTTAATTSSTGAGSGTSSPTASDTGSPDDSQTGSDSSSRSTETDLPSEYQKTRKTITGIAIAIIVAGTLVGLLTCVGIGCCVWRCTRRRRLPKLGASGVPMADFAPGKAELDNTSAGGVPYPPSTVYNPSADVTGVPTSPAPSYSLHPPQHAQQQQGWGYNDAYAGRGQEMPDTSSNSVSRVASPATEMDSGAGLRRVKNNPATEMDGASTTATGWTGNPAEMGGPHDHWHHVELDGTERPATPAGHPGYK